MSKMFFAEMCCLGFHNDCAGVTGFESCIGVAFVGDRPIYAGHFPFNSDRQNKEAADAFAALIKRTESKWKRGQLFVFTNGGQRPSAQSEAEYLCRALGRPATKLYVIGDRYLGRRAATAKPATVMLKHAINGLVKLYKHIPEPDGFERTGKPATLTYAKVPLGGITIDESAKVRTPSLVPNSDNLNGAWHLLDDPTTCQIVKIR